MNVPFTSPLPFAIRLRISSSPVCVILNLGTASAYCVGIGSPDFNIIS